MPWLLNPFSGSLDYFQPSATGGTAGPPTGPAGPPGSLAGTYPNPTLSLTGVAAGTVGDASHHPVVTLTPEGRVSAVTSQLIGIDASQVVSGTFAPSLITTAGGWTDDGTANVHTTVATRTVGIGTSAPATGALLHAKSVTGTVNGMTALAVEQTTPSTNQEVGLLMTNQGATCLLGVAAAASAFVPTNITFHQNSPLGTVWLQLAGCKNDGFDNINVLQSEFNVSGWINQFSWIPLCKGNDTAYTAGASTTGDQVIRAYNFKWPVANANDDRIYKWFLGGKIARAAGGVHLKIQWGRNSAPPVIFDWASGAATWANAYWWLEIDMVMNLQAGWYAARLWLVADPATAPAAAVATPYLVTNTYTLSGTGDGVLNAVCNFDTSNAGNSVTVQTTTIVVSKGR